MRNIWVTSDTHYNHKNIVKGTTTWNDFEKGSSHQSTRDFNTLEEHNQKLVDNINSCVKRDDILYHLGDWSFGGINSIWDFRKQLNCRNIHLILGNHDEKIANNNLLLPNCIYRPYGVHIIDLPPNTGKCFLNNQWIIDGVNDVKHVVKCTKPILAVPVQQLFSSVQHYLELNINKTKIVMSHFSMKVWNKSHKGSIHLYGHSHGSLPGIGKSMDIGVDTNNLFPYHLDEILNIMSKKDIVYIDHHNNNTN